jgi:hypothetical protein
MKDTEDKAITVTVSDDCIEIDTNLSEKMKDQFFEKFLTEGQEGNLHKHSLPIISAIHSLKKELNEKYKYKEMIDKVDLNEAIDSAIQYYGLMRVVTAERLGLDN